MLPVADTRIIITGVIEYLWTPEILIFSESSQGSLCYIFNIINMHEEKAEGNTFIIILNKSLVTFSKFFKTFLNNVLIVSTEGRKALALVKLKNISVWLSCPTKFTSRKVSRQYLLK